MDGGELAAIFRSLAEDTAQAAESAGRKIAFFYDNTGKRAIDSVTTLQNAEGANLDAIGAMRARLDAGGPGGLPAAVPAADGADNPVARLLNGPRARYSGGTARPADTGSVRSWELDDKWAGEAYEQIRGADDAADVAARVRDVSRPGGGTGFTRAEIDTVKQHVFFARHPLDVEDGKVVTGRFDPDPDMAEAWLRLRAGTFKPQDITLLEHELAEYRYWQEHPGTLYPEAHAAANQAANWQRDVPARTGEDYSRPWR